MPSIGPIRLPDFPLLLAPMEDVSDLPDINFGCPVKKVVAKGAGAAVLKDADLMERLTAACVSSTKLPVTVKMRLGCPWHIAAGDDECHRDGFV